MAARNNAARIRSMHISPAVPGEPRWRRDGCQVSIERNPCGWKDRERAMTQAGMLKRLAIVALLAHLAGAAHAQDTLKIAVGQRGGWEQCVSELGQNAGIFRKNGLAIDVLYTQGSGETLQSVISASVDIGIGVGTHGLLGAFAKGAPVRA